MVPTHFLRLNENKYDPYLMTLVDRKTSIVFLILACWAD